jgi:hypothetical protein
MVLLDPQPLPGVKRSETLLQFMQDGVVHGTDISKPLDSGKA